MSEVLIVHGTADSVIPVADAHEWKQHIKNRSLCLIEGGDHNFTQSEHARQMIDAVVKHCCQ
jgi:pimeloyl-ACP methyl ester carboxylesterase